MKFTPATNQASPQITIVFRSMNLHYSLEVSHSSGHIKDIEIREGLKDSRYSVTQNRGPSYTITGGTRSDLKQVEEELKVEYGLVDDAVLLSRIAIEIAIGASQTNGMRLSSDDFPSGFDVVKAAESGGFMNVCLETARNVLKLLKLK